MVRKTVSLWGALALFASLVPTLAVAAPTSSEARSRNQWRLEILLTRARLQLDAGLVADALQSCVTAQETGLWDTRLQSLLGEVYVRQEKWVNAAVALRRATGSRRDKQLLAEAATELGWERREAGAVDDAVRLWKEAVEADSSSAWAHSSLGLGYLAKRSQKLAETQCRLATELAPDWSGAWGNLGLALYVSGNPAAAETALLKALQLAPNDPVALNNLAFTQLEEGNAADALAIWEKLAGEGVATADQLAGLAIGYLAVGQREKAIATFRQATALNSSYLKPDVLASRHYWSAKAITAACELLVAMQGQ